MKPVFPLYPLLRVGSAHSVIVKDLHRVLQDGVNHLALPRRVRDVGLGAAHERGPEHDGQVLARHAIHAGILDDAVQVQGDRAEGGVVRVWEVVDGRVQRITADDVIVVLWWWD